MACPNCFIFKKDCAAECCSIVPMKRETFAVNFDKCVRPVCDLQDVGNDDVLPITEDGKCTFLTAGLECAIYTERPEVCKKFGDETHINMTCAFQSKTGVRRSLVQQKKIHNKQKESLNKFLGKNVHADLIK